MSNNELQSTTGGELIAAGSPLDERNLKALGLTTADTEQILEISKSLVEASPADIHSFGRGASQKTEEYSSRLLDQVRNTDLDSNGEKLGEVVRIARNLNLKQFAGRSKLPIIGPVIDRMRLSRGELVQRFTNTKDQIDQLMTDVGTTSRDLSQRIQDMESMWEAVDEERHNLGMYVAAGRIRLAELETERAHLHGMDDPQSLARLAEIDNAVRLLDKRVGDLAVLQHAAYQALPMIRIIQANNAMLVDKFHAIREVTIPAWKRSFTLQLALNEQRNAVELADAVDNATNEMLLSNAKLLHQNAVGTAKANQRLAIDVETLEQVNNMLIKTVEDVRTVHREGMAKRRQAVEQILHIREDVSKRLAAPTSLH